MDGCALKAQELASVRKKLAESATQFDIFQLLREVTVRYGYKYFAVSRFPDQNTKNLSELTVITSVPSDLLNWFDQGGLVATSPTIKMMQVAGAPFERRLGGHVPERNAHEQGMVASLLSKYSLNSWLVVPVFTPLHEAAVISFIGERNPLDFSEMAELCLLSSLINERLRQVSSRPQTQACPFTERERECLAWTAAGKTSIEIAKILSLSEHTVNHHLNNATRKIGTVNRTQTVATALRNGWIE